MKTDLKSGDTVRLVNPQAGEEDARYILLDDPAAVEDRVDIRLICHLSIAPIERVNISEICAS